MAKKLHRTIAIALAGALATILPLQAHAADPSGKYMIRGAGGQNCEAFLRAAGNPDQVRGFTAWLLGYATAHNHLLAGVFDILPTTDGGDFARMVAVACQRNPAAQLENVAAAVVTTIRPLAQSSETPLVTVTSGEASVQVRQGALRLLQQALAGKRVWRGQADGQTSPQFVQALKDFQKKEEIRVTGLPDIDTFIRAVLK